MKQSKIIEDCRKKKCVLVKNSSECKLVHFHANCPKSALKDESMLKLALIEKISRASQTKYGDELIKFMDTYGLINLQQATRKQLEEYIANNLDKGVEK